MQHGPAAFVSALHLLLLRMHCIVDTEPTAPAFRIPQLTSSQPRPGGVVTVAEILAEYDKYYADTR